MKENDFVFELGAPRENSYLPCFSLDITFSGFVLNWKWMLLDASHVCRNLRANGNRQASTKQTCLFFLWTPKLSNRWNTLSKKGNYDHAFEKWS
jgi:hypothetical protein